MVINSLFAALGFFFIPALIGRGVKTVLNYNVLKHKEGNGAELSYLIIEFFRSFAYGALFLYINAVLVEFLNLSASTGLSFAILIASLTLLYSSLSAVLIVVTTIKTNAGDLRLENTRRELITLLFLVLFASIVYIIWRWDSPTPYTLNWDIYHHQTLVNNLLKDGFDVMTSRVSDSFQFNGYSTLFHTIIMLTQSLFKADTLMFWWFVEFFHLLATTAIAYSFTYQVSKNRSLSILSALISSLTFESLVAYTTLFLIPQNLAATITIVFLGKIIYNHRKNVQILPNLVNMDFAVFTLYITLNHIFIGVLAIFLLIFTASYLHFSRILKENNKKFENFFVISSAILVLLIPVISSLLNLDFINRGEAAYFNFDIKTKFELMKTFYGYTLLCFVPPGIAFALKTKELNYKLLVILSFGVMALVISSIPYSLKLLSVGRYFIVSLIAVGLWGIIEGINWYLKAAVLSIFALSLGTILVLNIETYKQVPFYKGWATHVTENEIEAAKFLKYNYANTNAMLVSDPATMHILEGISGINSPGGAYTGIETRKQLSNIYYSRDSRTMTKELSLIRDSLNTNLPETILFVVSGRFSKWATNSEENRFGIHWNVWQPQDLSPNDKEEYEFISFLREKLNYKEVYANEGLVIFEIDTYRTFNPQTTTSNIDAIESTSSQ